MRKKTTGYIPCLITGYTPMWIDAVNAKSKAPLTFFLKFNMSDDFRALIDHKIAKQPYVAIFAKKMPEAGHYQFIRMSQGQHIGIRKRTENKIKTEQIYTEAHAHLNPVRSGKRMAYANGNGARFDRLNGKIGALIEQCVDLSKEREEWRREKAANQYLRQRQKTLIKLRRKYFEHRAKNEELALLPDYKWDNYLLQNFGGDFASSLNDSDLEAELMAEGVL